MADDECTPELSVEHIVPADLGGRLTTHDLLCKGCNSWLGTRVDAPLCKQFELILGMLGIVNARDKTPASRVPFHADDGGLYVYDPQSNSIDPVRVAREEELPDGRTKVTERLPVGTDLDAYAQKLQERFAKRGASLEVGESRSVTAPAPGIEQRVVIDDDYRRGIAKMGLLFSAHVRRDVDFRSRDYDPIRESIKGKRAASTIAVFPPPAHLELGDERFPKHLLTSFCHEGLLYAHVILFGVLVHLVKIGPAPPSGNDRQVAYEVDPWEHCVTEVSVDIEHLPVPNPLTNDKSTLEAGMDQLKINSEHVAQAK